MSETMKPTAKLSVFDRLLLDESWENVRSQDRANRLARAAVRRDLEILFNSRPRWRSWDPALTELSVSNLSYGLPDIQTMQIADNQMRQTFRQLMEDAIAKFEPRLKDVRVEIPPSTDRLDRSFRFRIHAILVSDADGEPIVYDTVLDRTARTLSIVGADRALDPGSL
jgi:type VI secretion system protein ImpF